VVSSDRLWTQVIEATTNLPAKVLDDPNVAANGNG